ncbi:MAG: Uncharacterized protein G01um101448_212 [Parcubacteria group bacterium Gr01-1014_48]|nr:MAG: Uncharacterized protein G01um101448_212 [Parcubacteria group bacterium Gr01-1014_48]
MRFQTPQFIGIEDKILGPLTLKQFIYLAGSAGSVALLDVIFPRLVALMLGAPIVIFGCMLAFYKYNGKPFIVFVESAFQFFFSAKLYLWKKTEKKIQAQKKSEDVNVADVFVPRLSDSKLKDLAWSLDIHDITQETIVNK